MADIIPWWGNSQSSSSWRAGNQNPQEGMYNKSSARNSRLKNNEVVEAARNVNQQQESKYNDIPSDIVNGVNDNGFLAPFHFEAHYPTNVQEKIQYVIEPWSTEVPPDTSTMCSASSGNHRSGAESSVETTSREPGMTTTTVVPAAPGSCRTSGFSNTIFSENRGEYTSPLVGGFKSPGTPGTSENAEAMKFGPRISSTSLLGPSFSLTSLNAPAGLFTANPHQMGSDIGVMQMLNSHLSSIPAATPPAPWPMQRNITVPSLSSVPSLLPNGSSSSILQHHSPGSFLVLATPSSLKMSSTVTASSASASGTTPFRVPGPHYNPSFVTKPGHSMGVDSSPPSPSVGCEFSPPVPIDDVHEEDMEACLTHQYEHSYQSEDGGDIVKNLEGMKVFPPLPPSQRRNGGRNNDDTSGNKESHNNIPRDTNDRMDNTSAKRGENLGEMIGKQEAEDHQLDEITPRSHGGSVNLEMAESGEIRRRISQRENATTRDAGFTMAPNVPIPREGGQEGICDDTLPTSQMIDWIESLFSFLLCRGCIVDDFQIDSPQWMRAIELPQHLTQEEAPVHMYIDTYDEFAMSNRPSRSPVGK